MTISNQNADTVGQLPPKPSDKAFGQLAAILRSLANGYHSYGAAVGSFAPDSSAWGNVVEHFATARALTEDPLSVWVELTEVYRVDDDKPAGWAVQQAPARPLLAHILARETGWTNNEAAAVAAVVERTGSLGISISTLDHAPAWKANTCNRVRAALVTISAARRKFAEWIVRNIGSSEPTQQLFRAVAELDNEIAHLKTWTAIFRQQYVDQRLPH